MKATPPTIFLYASTLRWFQKYQVDLLSNNSISSTVSPLTCFHYDKPLDEKKNDRPNKMPKQNFKSKLGV